MVTNINSKQNSNNQPLEKPRIIRWPIVHDKVGLCRSHVHKLVSQGRFPHPIKLGLRSSGWVESEVDTWLEQRIAESRPNNPEAA
jgi:prophage regulatory protein